MATPNVDRLRVTYTNLTERFFDRWQQAIESARSGNASPEEVSGVALEAMIDGFQAVAEPWLLLFDGTLTYPAVLRTFRFEVDAAKTGRTKRTGMKLDAAVVLDRQILVNVDDNTKKTPKAHILVSKSPNNRLVIKTDWTNAPANPAGTYEGNVIDTANNGAAIAKIVVEWPG